MSSEPKRKLAYSVYARSEATKPGRIPLEQSQFKAVRDNFEIGLRLSSAAAIIRQEADSLAMTADHCLGLILISLRHDISHTDWRNGRKLQH